MWVVGQRVFAELVPELGLGTVIEIVGVRFVEVLFSRAEVTRRYAQKGAPLRRMRLSAGQKARLKDGEVFVVRSTQEQGGLLLYVGEARQAWEYELGELVEDASPLQTFLVKPWSQAKHFGLRERAWAMRGKGLDPDLRGLVGPKVALLPHQLYIAHLVAAREFPRVLLADEVGLGKTIEAGLIFSTLRSLGRAERVLVLVPESLKHQWLAEMYRRFNEMFTVIDVERSEEEELSQGSSVFQMNQKVICSLEFLLENLSQLEGASAEPWDLLVVDEAHHLQWSEDDPSPEWEIVQHLSKYAKGLLLLTATPEHRGMETEFGLLNLVDPDRFPSFPKFEKETSRMQAIAKLARKLQEEERGAAFLSGARKTLAGESDLLEALAAYEKGAGPHALLGRLVDRHGTGRVLIRNRRSRLKGFPERRFFPARLEAPKAWLDYLKTLPAAELEPLELLALGAGRLRQKRSAAAEAWFNARADWLLATLKKLGDEKVLVICTSTARVVELQEWLRETTRMRTAVFHEDLEIVERDRQAAWFAEPEGAQVLICSEIGGEGRNFQFSRHLILFDLPTHPDVVEQRIGRLDRIGQARAIEIHVPCLADTPEEVLLRWYAEGLSSFTQALNGGAAIDELIEELAEQCRVYLPKAKGYAKREASLEKFLERTRETAEQLRERQRQSVDLLVDLNSFDESKGKDLAHRIHQADVAPGPREFLESAFDHFGVDTEILDEAGTLKVSSHSLTFVENFPGLTAHGELLATFDREHALSREELTFVTWDHPVMQGALSLILEGDTGRASAGVGKAPRGQSGAWLELLYVLEAVGPRSLELERDLPVTVSKVYLNMEGKPVPPPPSFDEEALAAIPPDQMAAIQERLRGRLPEIVAQANDAMERDAAPRLEAAIRHRRQRLGGETERLRQLARVNPLITEREITEHETKSAAGIAALKESRPRLEGIRLVILT
jgi:ATP-dependent helicase HepA